MSSPHRLRGAVIGAGPAGFYAADQLLGQGFEVDLYDVLPTPFGLVRAGVAPDHPKIKSVTRVYEKTAAKPGFRFFGGVELGTDVVRAELLERYHAVLYAIGTSDENRLGIPGEDRPGSYPATRFVAWYNGHPDAEEEVVLLGRRGPAQAAFTNPELRELGELTRADIHVDPAELELDAHSERWLAEHGEPTARRNVALLREYAARPPQGKSHRVTL